MSSRWDSYAEVHASSLTGNEDVHVHEVYSKDGISYATWIDLGTENADSKITAFNTGDMKLNGKDLQKPGGLDALFACPKLHEEKTDAGLDQGKLVDALDLKLRAPAQTMVAPLVPSADAGWTTVKNVAKRSL